MNDKRNNSDHKQYTEEDKFISVLFDEWLKDEQCFDSVEVWNAGENRPCPDTAISSFLDHMKMRHIKDLGFLMFKEATNRLIGISMQSDLCPPCMLHIAMTLGATTHDAGRHDFYSDQARALLKSHHLTDEDSETFMRCISLCLKVTNDQWPIAYENSDEDEK